MDLADFAQVSVHWVVPIAGLILLALSIVVLVAVGMDEDLEQRARLGQEEMRHREKWDQ